MATPHDHESVEEMKEALQNNNLALVMAKIEEHLDRQNNTPLNIAITGESGSGKSSFVNALRGIDNKAEGAAPTGATETTSEVTPYLHPNYPNVTLWDLPGVGTTKFPADQYLKHVGFEKFDFFIIISDTRFRENDVKLAREIQKMKKQFYFVRSKIDDVLRAERHSQRDFSETRTKEQIKNNSIQGLQEQGIQSPQVFLVSSFKLHLHDFSLLMETLERELPEHKKNVLLLAMPNISQEVINKKKEAFQTNIKYVAAGSAAAAGVPVPGLSAAVDVTLLVGVVTQYLFGFGLDIPSLERLAENTGVTLDDLTAVTISPLAATKITTDLIIKVLTQCARTGALMVAEEGSRFIPIIGIPVAMGLSFITTYRALNGFLNMLADDAQRVFEMALFCKHVLSNISQPIINKKKEAFQANIKYVASLSALGAGVPVPGLSVGVDAVLLAGVVKQYIFGFHLDTQSLQSLAAKAGVPFDDVMAVITSPLAARKITPDLIIKVLTQCASTAALMAAEEGSRFIPIIGIPAAMGLSFTATYRALNGFLNMLADDAQRVFVLLSRRAPFRVIP